MAHLSVATVIEKNRIASTVAFVPLIEIDIVDPSTLAIVETLRYARNTENIDWQDNEYTYANFDVAVKKEAGEIKEMTLTVRDYTRIIQSRMQEYGGGVGFEVRLYVVNTGNLAQPAEISETFEVIKASSDNYIVSFTLGGDNPLTRRFPGRAQFKDRCNWVYKGTECAYAGAMATCDYSLQGDNGCAAHNNTINFGGFPGIKIMDT